MITNNHSFQLKHPQRSFDDIFTDMKSIIERLAPEDGLYVLDEHENPVYCIFCGETSYKESPGVWGHVHESDCPWIEARKLMEELK